jgi:hypothetical protein
MDRKEANISIKGANAFKISIKAEVKHELCKIASISRIAKEVKFIPDEQTTSVNRLNLRRELYQTKLQQQERQSMFSRGNPTKNSGNPGCMLIKIIFLLLSLIKSDFMTKNKFFF